MTIVITSLTSDIVTLTTSMFVQRGMLLSLSGRAEENW